MRISDWSSDVCSSDLSLWPSSPWRTAAMWMPCFRRCRRRWIRRSPGSSAPSPIIFWTACPETRSARSTSRRCGDGSNRRRGRWPPHNQIRERIMKFGLFGGAARGADQSGDSQSYRSFVDYVVGAEELGFESLFLVEHHFTGAGQLSASMTLLSYLAGLTTRMRLGTGVTVLPWHNPVLMAEQAATVDVVRSEEQTSELQSLMRISYAVFCLKQKTRARVSS